VAPTDTTVLIQGESGTGKELIARAIHEASRRQDQPMIRVNCASIPRDLFESEFFGHVRGAFTGAIRDRAGRFQLADGGTIFLDEVGEIPPPLQSKLLRVIQEGELERIGEDVTRCVDVRIIAATNRDLKAEADAARFRKDLYFRLSVFPVEVAPLRERLDDIGPLAKHFLALACRRLGKPPPPLRQRHVLQLQRYDWPGNVRELQNVIERAVIVSAGGELRLDLPAPAGADVGRYVPVAHADESAAPAVLTYDELKRRERDNILAALRQAGGQVSGPGGAAQLLGVRPTTLASKMKAMRIRPKN